MSGWVGVWFVGSFGWEWELVGMCAWVLYCGDGSYVVQSGRWGGRKVAGGVEVSGVQGQSGAAGVQSVAW